MLSIDVAALLHPVSEDAPCGQNLEYDPAFGELERSAQGTPERVMGDNVIAAQEPDWREVRERALALFDRTKDLRVAVHLLEAELRTAGLPAFASGLALIHKLMREHWDHVHPQLDKEDDDDPTLRLNCLLPLNDRAGIIARLTRCPLIQSRTFGRVTLRDVRVAAGELAPEGDASLDAAQIDAAFLDGDVEELQGNAEAVRAALEELAGLTACLNERVRASLVPDLAALAAELRVMERVLSAQLARRGAVLGEESGDGAAAAHATGAASAGAADGAIRSREDVIRQLDRICEYFRRNEPSSPVPLLLQRAKGLVSKDFLEILSDLTPDAVSQAKVIAGLDKNE